MENTQKAQAIQQGADIIANMSDNERAMLGSASGDVKFIRLLGNPYSTQPIIGKGSAVIPGTENTPKTIGMLFEALKDVEVPVITPSKKVGDAVTAADIGKRTIKAGSQFALTLVEVYFFAIRSEYSLYFGADVNGEFSEKGCKISLKWSSKGSKLPTPSAKVEGVTLRKNTLAVCSGDAKAPVFENDELARFEPIVKKVASSVAAGGTKADPKAAAIRDAEKMAASCRKNLEAMGLTV